MNAWHNRSIPEVAGLLATGVEQGLTDEEVAVRLTRYGPNKLRKGKRFSALVILVSQFKSLVVWVLIVLPLYPSPWANWLMVAPFLPS